MRFACIKTPRQIFPFIALLLSLGFSSCGNENSWTYKAWHNTLAHYNIFFNGEQKWLETYETARESYKDDFRKPLNLFNYGTLESLQGNLGAMDEVVKKASTMIDKHPKSKWVDDAYLLTGKAYLFKGDATAAINIFEYVASQYKDPKIRFNAKLWTIKALVLQDKIVDAEAMATAVLKNKELPKSLEYRAQFTLGAIYHMQKKYQQSAELLSKALPKISDRMERYRTYFALGQAFQKTGDYKKAESAYAKVPRFNPPYEITFNAQIEQVSILSAQQRDFNKANKILMRMLKDDKNIDYKGQIYYRMALNELDAGNTNKALSTLKTSAIHSANDKNQKTTSFLKIGDVYYQQRQYESAGRYYDSANRFLDETHPDFEAILSKNQIVTDLLEKLVTIAKNDSLIRLVRDEEWLNEKIRIAKKKEKDEEEQARQIAERAKNNNTPSPFPNNPGMPMNPVMGGGGSGGSFPFYNVVTRKNGLTEFKRLYGERPNVDFWKYASKMQLTNASGDPKGNTDTKNDSANTELKPKNKDLAEKFKNIAQEDRKYIENLPFDPSEQETLLAEVELALFESAGIYANKLNEYETAFEQYSKLLNRFTQSILIPQTYYEVIKVQRLLNHPSLVKLYTDTLKKQFPESVYVRMLDNPDAASGGKSTLSQSNLAIQNLYDSMVVCLQLKDFAKAQSLKLAADKSYSGNSLQPRFDYVYGLCLLQTDSAKGVETLKQLSLDYPNTDVADRAKNLLVALENKRIQALPDSVKTKISEGSDFTIPASTESLDAIFIIPKEANVNLIKALISDLNKKEFSMDPISIGRHIPLNNKYIIILENFPTGEKTKFYSRYMMQQQETFTSRGVFEYQVLPVSKDNLQRLVKSQNIDGYAKWYTNQNN